MRQAGLGRADGPRAPLLASWPARNLLPAYPPPCSHALHQLMPMVCCVGGHGKVLQEGGWRRRPRRRRATAQQGSSLHSQVPHQPGVVPPAVQGVEARVQAGWQCGARRGGLATRCGGHPAVAAVAGHLFPCASPSDHKILPEKSCCRTKRQAEEQHGVPLPRACLPPGVGWIVAALAAFPHPYCR